MQRIALLMIVLLMSGASVFAADKKANKPAAPEAPAAEAPAAEAPAAEAPADSDATRRALLGDFSLGPIISIAIPRPISFGLETKYKNIAGASFNYGFLPSITLGSASAEMSGWDLRARWFPFSRALFVGAAFGNQLLTASKTETVDVAGTATATTTSLDVSTTFLTPHIGWRWGAYEGTGFFTGMELGFQMSLSNSTTLTTTGVTSAVEADPDYQKIKADVTKLGDDVGKSSLPHFAIFQFGWMF